MIAKSDLCIYAIGGGHGHATRSISLAKELHKQKKYKQIELLCSKESVKYIRDLPSFIKLHHMSWLDFLRLKVKDFRSDLIVDTFPCGVVNEIDKEHLGYFKSTHIVARYNSKEADKENYQCYDQVWLPYLELNCEWEGSFSKDAKYIGLQVDKDKVKCIFESGKFVLIDPYKIIPSELKIKIRDFSQNEGFEYSYLTRFTKDIYAEKVFVIGAGYNTFYEWLDSPVDIKFMPLKRKYDDQYYRAKRYNKDLCSLVEFIDWIQEREV